MNQILGIIVLYSISLLFILMGLFNWEWIYYFKNMKDLDTKFGQGSARRFLIISGILMIGLLTIKLFI